MKSIAVFNNKGGVGKSTATLFLADFFASTNVTVNGKHTRLLVCDLDGQCSSAVALVGKYEVKEKIDRGLTVGALVEALSTRPSVPFDDYLIWRQEPGLETKKIKLGQLWTMVTDSDVTFGLEARARDRLGKVIHQRLFPSLADHFDIVIFDLAAKIKPDEFLSLGVLQTVDHILVPTQPTALAANALDKTAAIIQQAQSAAKKAGHPPPKVAGVLLNQLHKGTKAYKLHAADIDAFATRVNSSVLTNGLPSAPALTNATDDSLSYETLKARYDTYYDHVRKVAKEVAERCGYIKKR